MTMDPTQAVSDLRMMALEGDHTIGEKFHDLDQWLSRGGFLPDQWNNMGRPRMTGDGDVVLDNVTHGKASSYSRGCRCAECREANRTKAARWRASHRMEK